MNKLTKHLKGIWKEFINPMPPGWSFLFSQDDVPIMKVTPEEAHEIISKTKNMIPRNTQKRCFAPCPVHKVNAGLCDCHNTEELNTVPNTTILKTLPDDGFLGSYDVTACCGTGPIITENFCPMCGSKIERGTDAELLHAVKKDKILYYLNHLTAEYTTKGCEIELSKVCELTAMRLSRLIDKFSR